MNKMLMNINRINDAIAELKEEFKLFIVDKDIPLTERWNTFVAGNDALKDFDSCIYNFESLPEDFIGYDCTIHAERHETISTKDIVERIQEIADEVAECGDPDGYYKDFVEGNINIDALKEEILAANLGSFEYDW